jgi:endonuclease-8
MRDPARASTSVAEVLVDQRVMAGLGNVYKSEVLWLERVAPSVPVVTLDDSTLARLIETARRLLVANADRRHGPERVTTSGADRRAVGSLYVYGRTGRPCRRCGTPIASVQQGRELPRTTYWCPTCQPIGAVASVEHV